MTNILLNSNMETPNSANPSLASHWYVSTTGYTNPKWVTDSSHSASHSYKFDLSAANTSNVPRDGGNIVYSPKPTVIPNKQYRVTIWRRLENVNIFTGTPTVTPQMPYLRIGQQRADGTWNRFDDLPLGITTKPWEQLLLNITTLADTVAISVEVIFKNGSGILWVDDIYIDDQTTPTTGSISFSSTPTGAKIFIDNVDKGVVTNTVISNVTSGTHSYRLTLAGYNDATGSVNVVAGQTTSISVTLTAIQLAGNITVITSPPQALVILDNVVQTGVTPITIQNVVPGIHSYRISLTGYNDSTGSVSVVAGQTVVINVQLIPIPPTPPPSTPPPTTPPITTPPPSGCIGCDTTKNICIADQCIPKAYVIYTGVGFVALLLLTR